MDLLVFLVRRRELDVAYVSVSAIARDYLNWLERNGIPDIDSAGDFILLAATLLQFKALNLLPGSDPDTSDAEINSLERHHSEEELASLREAAVRMAALEERQANLFDRGTVHLGGLDEEVTNEMLSDVSKFDLALAFRDLIYQLPQEPTHVIEDMRYTIEGQTAFIMAYFGDETRLAFDRLADALVSRLAVIMTFLAILELIRIGRVRVMQREAFGPLWLIRRKTKLAIPSGDND